MESTRHMQRLRVAVIGAGAAGLVALRHLRDHLDTFQPVAFEQTQQIGGTWVYTDEVGIDSSTGRPVHSSMYRHLRVNIPKEVPPLILKSVMVVRLTTTTILLPLYGYLWSPYVIGQTIIFSCCGLFLTIIFSCCGLFFFMVALWNRETIYIFMLWFLLLLSSFSFFFFLA